MPTIYEKPVINIPKNKKKDEVDVAVSPEIKLPIIMSNSAEKKNIISDRCKVCNKKTGLIKFNCKCNPEMTLCITHRYPTSHECNYDYQKEQKKILEKNNPLVVNDKLNRI